MRASKIETGAKGVQDAVWEMAKAKNKAIKFRKATEGTLDVVRPTTKGVRFLRQVSPVSSDDGEGSTGTGVDPWLHSNLPIVADTNIHQPATPAIGSGRESKPQPRAFDPESPQEPRYRQGTGKRRVVRPPAAASRQPRAGAGRLPQIG